MVFEKVCKVFDRIGTVLGFLLLGAGFVIMIAGALYYEVFWWHKMMANVAYAEANPLDSDSGWFFAGLWLLPIVIQAWGVLYPLYLWVSGKGRDDPAHPDYVRPAYKESPEEIARMKAAQERFRESVNNPELFRQRAEEAAERKRQYMAKYKRLKEEYRRFYPDRHHPEEDYD
jgi:hypothetical protein